MRALIPRWDSRSTGARSQRARHARIAAIALLLALGLASGAPAQEAAISDARRQAAVDLLALMDLERTMLGGAAATADAMIANQPALELYRGVLLEWAGRIMTWEAFQPRFVEIYAEAYTEKELRELADFYRTSTGRKSLEVGPELMRRGAMVGKQVAREHLDELQSMLEARTAELEKQQAEAESEPEPESGSE